MTGFRSLWFAILLLSMPENTATAQSLDEVEILAEAQRSYRTGLDLREDSERARPHLLRAGERCDELWERGVRNAALAQLRANAHLLVGKLGHAIRAYREGLLVAPFDRELAFGLSSVRESIRFPNTGNLAAQAKVTQPVVEGFRISWQESWPWILLLYAGGCFAFARWRMRHQPGIVWLCLVLWLAASATAVLTVVSERRAAQAAEQPSAVVDDPGCFLFSGNGEHYAKKLDRLPAGVEVEVLATRGSWYQVRLSGGMVGWLPVSALLVVRTK